MFGFWGDLEAAGVVHVDASLVQFLLDDVIFLVPWDGEPAEIAEDSFLHARKYGIKEGAGFFG